MRVNGKETELNRAELVAVERNGQIVPRAEFGAAVLTDSDELEIVSFVGGG